MYCSIATIQSVSSYFNTLLIAQLQVLFCTGYMKIEYFHIYFNFNILNLKLTLQKCLFIVICI